MIGCPAFQWTGDGFCDDSTNIIECNYDGGDCCGSNVDDQYCTQCLCIEGGAYTNPPTTGTVKIRYLRPECSTEIEMALSQKLAIKGWFMYVIPMISWSKTKRIRNGL